MVVPDRRRHVQARGTSGERRPPRSVGTEASLTSRVRGGAVDPLLVSGVDDAQLSFGPAFGVRTGGERITGAERVADVNDGHVDEIEQRSSPVDSRSFPFIPLRHPVTA